MKDHAAVSLRYKDSQIGLGTVGVQYSFFSIATPEIQWTKSGEDEQYHKGADGAEPQIDAGNDFKLEFSNQTAINMFADSEATMRAGHKQTGSIWQRIEDVPMHCVDFECHGTLDGKKTTCWLRLNLRGKKITGTCNTCFGVQDVLLFTADAPPYIDKEVKPKDKGPWQGGKMVPWKLASENKSRGFK